MPVNPYQPGTPFQVPSVPQHFVPRPEYANRVRNQLLNEDMTQPTPLVVSAVHGVGGIGKSVLAAAIAHEPTIRDRFPDGVLWVTLGQEPDLLPLLGNWIDALDGRGYVPTTAMAASNYLESLLVDKTMLLVVDDLWNPDHFEPFRLVGQSCRVLVTTREVQIEGAQQCEVGVLSPAESAALVENCLGRSLAGTEQESFSRFAKAVGYLPLALELAVVQLDADNDWQTLLNDLSTEFDRLDLNAVDISESMRRQRSLRACFNLSLQRLNTEQLRRFAWFGVLPEDVFMDARMVATLWQVSLSEAQQGLVEFWERSLLLSGGEASVDGVSQPTFRQHDLLHDLARELLAESSSAVLPGLELSVAVAHNQLLDRYRPASGKWSDLPDDGYIHQRLTWHMEKSGQIAEMQTLIRAANESGRNAWGEACEQLGLLTVFVEDLARAWRCAEERYGIIPTEPEGWRWQFWCAFATVSLNSLVGNLPGKLLATAVRQGHWSESRVVAYALQKWDEKQRAVTLADLIPELRGWAIVDSVIAAAEDMTVENRNHVLMAVMEYWANFWPREKALEIARQLPFPSGQAQALIGLAEEQPDLFGEALDVVAQIPEKEYDRINILCGLVEKLPIEWFSKALEITRQISHGPHRIRALGALADKQSELFGEVLETVAQVVAQQMSAQYYRSRPKRVRAQEFIELAERLPIEWFGRALEINRQLPNELDQIEVLTALGSKRPELFGEALEVTRQISEESSQAKMLEMLVEKLPAEFLGEATEMARRISGASARANTLGVQRQPELFGEALEAISQISDERSQGRALMNVLKKLPNERLGETLELPRQITNQPSQRLEPSELSVKLPAKLVDKAVEMISRVAWAAPQVEMLDVLEMKQSELHRKALGVLSSNALEAIARIRDEDEGAYERTQAIQALVAKLPVKFMGQALELTRQTGSDDYRADELIVFADKLPNELLDEALEITRQMGKSHQARALIAFANRLPELWSEAIAVTRQVPRTFDRVQVLSIIAENRPELLGEILATARQISDEPIQVQTLVALANRQPELWDEVLVLTRQVSETKVLEVLADTLPAARFGELLSSICQISDESDRAEAIVGLADKLPNELFDEALEIARQITYKLPRARALKALAETQPELFREVLEVTGSIAHESNRGWFLIRLVDKLPAELFGEALEIVRQISRESERGYLLQRLSEKLPTEWFGTALEIASQFSDEEQQAEVMKVLAETIPAELVGAALEITRQIAYADARGEIVIKLADRIPTELVGESLEMIRPVYSWFTRAEVLCALAEKIPAKLLGEALEILCPTSGIHSSTSEPHRNRALVAVAKQLPVERFGEAIEVVCQISRQSERDRTLSALWRALPTELPTELCRVVLELTSTSSYRSKALVALASKLPAERFSEAIEMTDQISRWSDRDDALKALVENLPTELLSEAFALIGRMRSGENQAQTLIALSEKYPRLRGEALQVIRQISSKTGRVKALIALSEKQPQLCEEALQVIRQMLKESDRVRALIALSEKQPQLRDVVLQVIRQIPKESDRVRELRALASKHPDSLEIALELPRQISSDRFRAEALIQLADKLPSELFDEALEIARHIPDNKYRYQVQVLMALIDKLPARSTGKARQIAFEIPDPDRRLEVLSRFTDRTSWEAIAEDHQENLLRLLSIRERKFLIELLPTLPSTLLELGGQTAIDAALDAMRDACKQWP